MPSGLEVANFISCVEDLPAHNKILGDLKYDLKIENVSIDLKVKARNSSDSDSDSEDEDEESLKTQVVIKNVCST